MGALTYGASPIKPASANVQVLGGEMRDTG